MIQSHIKKQEYIVLAFTAMWLCLVVTSQFLSAELFNFGISGLYVPDSIQLRESISFYWSVESQSEKLSAVKDAYQTFYLLLFIYWPGYLLGKLGYGLVNTLLLGFSWYFFRRVAVVFFGRKSASTSSIYYLVGLSLTLYVPLVFLFPSKEIPLLLFVNVWLYLLFLKRSILGALLVAGCCFLVRDGFGIILTLSTIFLHSVCKEYSALNAQDSPTQYWNAKYTRPFSPYRIRTPALLLGIFIGAGAMEINMLSDFHPAFRRNVNVGQAIQSDYIDLLSGPLGYYIRVVGNLGNLSLRPQVLSISGNIYILQVGFFMFGTVVLTSYIWLLSCRSHGLALDVARTILLLGLAGISFSTYVQPRYLFPYISLLILTFQKVPNSVKLLTFLLILIAAMVAAQTELLPDRQIDTDMYNE